MKITLIEDYHGFLLAILPPGGFIGLGFLIAIKNVINSRRERRVVAVAAPATQSGAPA